jgi:hypothetical protein
MERALEELIWERAGHLCEYCQMPQEYERTTFEIDHVIAQSRNMRVTPLYSCNWPSEPR